MPFQPPPCRWIPRCRWARFCWPNKKTVTTVVCGNLMACRTTKGGTGNSAVEMGGMEGTQDPSMGMVYLPVWMMNFYVKCRYITLYYYGYIFFCQVVIAISHDLKPRKKVRNSKGMGPLIFMIDYQPQNGVICSINSTIISDR